MIHPFLSQNSGGNEPGPDGQGLHMVSLPHTTQSFSQEQSAEPDTGEGSS